MTTSSQFYPTVDANPNFAAIEEAQLKFWSENKVFEQSVERRAAANPDGSSNQYVFYDGPPFANGLPHYGHLLTGYVKDAIARYHTMLGRRVERRFGWDCHGLPAEMGAEKDLGISGRAAIMGFGIDKFNAQCRSSVMKYTEDWRYYVTRQGRWVDFDNDYKTMDTPYMESVVWAFSELYKKGLIYESMRVMPYSWAAETPVSNFETRIDNATREREDKAAYVKFKLKEKPAGAPDAENYYLIAWTTTPWTLPANLALAVNKEMKYLAVSDGKNCYMYAEAAKLKLVKSMIEQLNEASMEVGVLETFLTFHSSTPYALPKEVEPSHIHEPNHVNGTFISGADLINLTYEPLFPYFADTKNAFRVLDGSAFVTDGDGTGIVHMAPGHGEVDQQCCANAEPPIEVVVPVDEKGRYTDAIFDIPWAATGASPAGGGSNPSLRIRGGGEKLGMGEHTTRDPVMLARAQAMRNDPTEVEKKLWHVLSDRKLADHKFRRQHAIGNYIVDFVCTSANLIIELDGGQHADNAKYDAERTAYLNQHHYRVIRFWNHDVLENLEGVVAEIESALGHPPEFSEEKNSTPRERGMMLRLRGLNVIADKRIDDSDLEGMDPRKVDKFKEHVAKYGLANMRIIRWLDERKMLVKQEEIKHNYPHCWRTDTPLIYRAMSSWYVNVQAIKANMAANNQTIHWIPDHVQQGQMGKGIESAPDWSISRNRFWGTPIPIWKSASGKIIVPGSIAEIEKLSGQEVADLHRPFIDNVVITKDGEEYRRIEDVFDCWFESGSMPYAQLHYPFENKQRFEETFPADFITEYIAQTRGWFYTLQVLSAALFGKAPFKNVICHGVVIDEETGLKYSKRLKNYRDPKEVMDAYGADALRWMMLASPVMRGADLAVDPEGKFIRDVVRLNIKPIWSAYNFFTLYANADGVTAKYTSTSHDMLDQYILQKCADAVHTVRISLEDYNTPTACEAIQAFFEALNNWYIRRSKQRFWKEENDSDKQAAYDTLYTVISVMCQAAAPLLPFTAEAVYRGLNGEMQSVHLTDYPKAFVEEVEISAVDGNDLLFAIDRVRDVCNAALSIRSTTNHRVRQPLQSLTIIQHGVATVLEDKIELQELVKDEVNVKKIIYRSDFNNYANLKLQINSAVLGKRLPEKMKQILPASKKGEWAQENGVVKIADEILSPNEYIILLEANPEYKKSAAPLSTNDALVILDLTITPELEAEGRARDLVRMIQQARKDGGFDVADRVALALELPADFKAALAEHRAYIAEQTLAVSISDAGAGAAAKQVPQELDGAQFIIGITKAA